MKLRTVIFASALLFPIAYSAASTHAVHSHKASVAATELAKVDINQADIKTLRGLQGIGKHKAEAIVNYRKAHGSFKNAQELLSVPGISQRILDLNVTRLIFTAAKTLKK